MWGAVIGDIAGSIYEYNQIKKITPIEVEKLIPDNGFYSDDTILTIAILEGMLNDKHFTYYLRKYGNEYKYYKPNINPYFRTSFSAGFIKWLSSYYVGRSIGNGAMMRVSSVGYLSKTEEEVIDYAYKATIPSHNTEEAIKCSTLIARIIFLSQNNYSKEEIIRYLNINYKYKPFAKFNTTCNETIDNCLYAVFESDSFIESLKKVISYGGDTDTNACIVGSIAEALYGIDNNLIESAKNKIPDKFVKKLDMGYKSIRK